jgi:4'-phosphopantetheinyl transferase
LRRFFQYWTLKESYIKARGLGLAIPLDQFSFHFRAERHVTLATSPSLQDPADRWRFWQLQVSAANMIAVCAQRLTDGPQQLILRQVVPLASEAPLEHTALCESPA